MTLSYRWMVLAVFFASQVALSIAAFGWGPLAPFLKEIMSLNSTQIGSIGSAFYFAAALSSFPAGLVVDRYGVKKGLLCWLGITGVPLFLLSLLRHSYGVFLLMVAVSGLGYGMGNPVASKGLFIWFDRRLRGIAFGIRQSAVMVGAAVSALLLVYIASASGPMIALRAVSMMIISIMVMAFFLYRSPEGREPSEDADPIGTRKKSWVARLKSFATHRALLTLSMVMAGLGLAQGIVVTFFLLYAYEVLGYSLMASGSLLSIVMISGAAGRIFWGVLSDRLFHGSRKPILTIICGLTALSVTALVFWRTSWPDWVFIPLIVAIGLSCVGWNSTAFVFVSEISDVARTGTAVGFASTIAWSGHFLGPVAFGGVVDHLGYLYAWSALALCCFLCLILCIFIPVTQRVRPVEKEESA